MRGRCLLPHIRRGAGSLCGRGKHVMSGSLMRAARDPAVLPAVGDYVELERSFDADATAAFASLSGDDNPLHLSEEFARDSHFGGRVVHGILVSSLFSTAFGTLYPGATYVSQSLRFVAPVPVGARVRARIEVLQVRARVRVLRCSTKCSVVASSAAGEVVGGGGGGGERRGGGGGGDVVAIDGEAVVMLPE